MRIGCLQFAPQLGDVDNNLNRADAVLHKANPDDLDLLVLPELAFSGYNFKNLQDIRPFLEHSGSGISSLWARTMALKYSCTVAVGYPEKVEWSSTASQRLIGPEYYNSAIVVNEDGETIANYRKSFLYYTDETWAQEGGRGFYEGFIPGLGNVSLGICMDLNPYKFQAPWHAFEFAYHVLRMDSNLVIVSMAWVTREDRGRFTSLPNEPDMETLTYWVTRLEPLIRSDNQDEIIVVFCNRTGHEDDVTFAGTSAVIGIQDGEVTVYGLLGRGQKELLVVDTNDVPYAKMVYRPDSSGDLEGELKSSDFENPTDYDESMEHEGDYEGSTSNYSFQNPSGDGEVKKSPVSTASLSPSLPRSPEKAEGSVPHSGHLPVPIAVPNETESIDLDSVVIPTPSAPSPTPKAARPRLVIPESPTILSGPYLSELPNSASSLSSEKSNYSVKSNESEASVATIRSNPRPPEDSTPYPGLNPGDYPLNDPLAAFDEISPASPYWYWPQFDRALHAQSSAGLTAGTPIGRQPEPFPWSSITSDMRPPSRQDTRTHVKEPATPQEVRNANSRSPLSNNSSYRTNKTHTASRSDSSGTSKGTIQERTGREARFARPSSPEPRIVGNFRMDERSKTPTAEIDVAFAISDYLDGVSGQVESTARMPSEPIEGPTRSEKGRPSWSRDCSRDQIGDPEPEHEMIRIAVSPSILTDDGRVSHRSSSRGTRQHQRSNSYSNVNGYLQGKNSHSAKSNHAANKARPSSPVAGRGRTQKAKVSASNDGTEAGISEIERASSADSTRNGKLHSRIRRRTESSQSRTRRPSPGQRYRQQSEEEVTKPKDPEIIPYPDFQRHSRHPSRGTLTSESTMLSDQSSPLQPSVSTPNTSPRRLSPTEFRDETLFSDDTNSLQQSCSTYNSSPVSTSPGGAESSDEGAPGTPPTTVTPKRFQSGTLFEPKTPKAMVIQMDEGYTETIHDK